MAARWPATRTRSPGHGRLLHPWRGRYPGKSHEEAAAIRTAESEAACKILGAKAVFAGQIDGATEANPGRAQSFQALLAAENPDVLFAHWPIDTHPDHQLASILTLRAY